jgi:hypothetical protein
MNSPITEKEIRLAVIDLLQKSQTENFIIEELGLCQGFSRADIACLNKTFTGFEIKSDYDSLGRLKVQIEYYNSVFDKIYLVTTNKHLSSSKKVLPKHWGVYLAKKTNGKVSLSRHRPSQKNVEVQSFKLVQLMWKDEVLNFFRKKNYKYPLYKKTKNDLYQILAENFKLRTLKKVVGETLKTRSNWRFAP